MKLRCKGCQKKIALSDYNCPFCGKVNFSTDEDVRAAYNAHTPKGAVGAFIAIKTTFVTHAIIFAIIAVIFGLVFLKICLDNKANNDWAYEHVTEWTEFDKANSSFGEKFEFTRVYSASAYPYYEMYITYNGKPEDFIHESISLCDMLYSYACEGHSSYYRDQLTFKLTCGEMMFNCDRSRYVETNVLFDYSELEPFGLKSLTVHTDKMTDEEKQRLNGASYPFELIIE